MGYGEAFCLTGARSSSEGSLLLLPVATLSLARTVVFRGLLNSLTAIDTHEHQLYNKLLWCVVTRRIFVCSQS